MKWPLALKIGCLMAIVTCIVVVGGIWSCCARAGRASELHRAIGQNDVDEVRAALARGASPNAVRYGSLIMGDPFDSDPALMVAVVHSHREIVAVLLEHGADPNKRNAGGLTALGSAFYHPDDEIIDMLLAHGADVNVKGDQGGTPLHMAAGQYYMDPSAKKQIVAVLLAHGADINARDNQGRTLLDMIHYMGGRGSEDVARFMREHGAVAGSEL